jgi:bacterioferritin-associated ferredoxin
LTTDDIESSFQYQNEVAREGAAVILCLCNAVSDAEVRAVITDGAHTVEAVGRACGAGTDCGSCRDDIADLIDEHHLTGRACGGGDCPRQAARVGALLPVAQAG